MTPTIDTATLVVVVINLMVTAYTLGRMRETQADHERRIAVLENIHPRSSPIGDEQ